MKIIFETQEEKDEFIKTLNDSSNASKLLALDSLIEESSVYFNPGEEPVKEKKAKKSKKEEDEEVED